MILRTVLKGDAGVLYRAPAGGHVLFSFRDQPWPQPLADALTREAAPRARAYRVYRVA
jgi:hypothetical protein